MNALPPLVVGLLCELFLGPGCRQAPVAKSPAGRWDRGPWALQRLRDPARGPLVVSSGNPRYFADDRGQIVYLTGSHTWANFQDSGPSDPPPRFDFEHYLGFLESYGHNFIRLWTWEQGSWTGETVERYRIVPLAFERVGPERALDGSLKFDLHRFNARYFERLAERVEAARLRGVYVSVMLFNGWSVEQKEGPSFGNPWRGHPFNRANNVNGIDGDPDQDGQGGEVHTLAQRDILDIQERYVRRVVDALNGFDNVLFEICNECDPRSMAWQEHMVSVVKRYEASARKQHVVGVTAAYPRGDNRALAESHADWISPNAGVPVDPGLTLARRLLSDWLGRSRPPTVYAERDTPNATTGHQVVVSDTDHLWGVGGTRAWVWKSFLRGRNLLVMDPYDGLSTGMGVPPTYRVDDPGWIDLRANIGYARAFARRMDLARVRPSQLSSTGYCLADVDGDRPTLLTYLPDGGSATLDLRRVRGTLDALWFNPGAGSTLSAAPIDGGRPVTLTAPFEGDAVLYLRGKA